MEGDIKIIKGKKYISTPEGKWRMITEAEAKWQKSPTGEPPISSYTVKPGDTLAAIAKKYGVKHTDIAGYKSGDPNLIYPGEVLTIPKGAGAVDGAPAGGLVEGSVRTNPTTGKREIYTPEGTWREISPAEEEYQKAPTPAAWQVRGEEKPPGAAGKEITPEDIYPWWQSMSTDELKKALAKMSTIPGATVAGGGGTTGITAPGGAGAAGAGGVVGGLGGVDLETDENAKRNEAIDSIQDTLDAFQKLQEARKGEEIPTRTRGYLEKLEGMIEEPVKPTRPGYVDEFEKLRDKYKVEPLEGEMSKIDKEIAALKGTEESAMAAVSERLAPESVIYLRELKLGKDFDRRMNALNLQKQTVLNELNMKYDTINNIMNLKKEDYIAARSDYEYQFNKQLTLYQIISGEEKWEWEQAVKAIQIEADAEQRNRTNALTNWQITSNAIKEQLKSGTISSMDDIPDETRLSLQRLEVQAGLPSGFTETVIGLTDVDENVLNSQLSEDQTKISVLIQRDNGELRIETFPSGLPYVAPKGVAGKVDKDLLERQYKAGLLTDKAEGMEYEEAKRYYGGYIGLDWIDRIYKEEEYEDTAKERVEKEYYEDLESWLDKVKAEPKKYYVTEAGVYQKKWGFDKLVFTFMGK